MGNANIYEMIVFKFWIFAWLIIFLIVLFLNKKLVNYPNKFMIIFVPYLNLNHWKSKIDDWIKYYKKMNKLILKITIRLKPN